MLPFPIMNQYGNIIPPADVIEYQGLISDIDFSYDTIVSIINPTGTLVSKSSNFRSYKFQYNQSIIILPSQPVAITSYKEVYEKGMVWGTDDFGPDIFDAGSGISFTLQNSTTTILGNTYRIRLMKGTQVDTISVSSDNPSYYDPMTEWERYVYSIWSNLISGYQTGYSIPTSDKIPRINYVPGTTRRWVLCQGSDGSRTSPISIGRGRFDTAATDAAYKFSQINSTSISPLWSTAQNLWWPIFEKV